MRFVSLFAGIGGFDLALETLGHECVYANDIDTYCKIIYDKHFVTKQTTQDIRTITSGDIPDHDILCGGFPCQSFSIAGKRGGFEDTRGTLFYEIARIAKAKRPSYLFLENVKGLLSHDDGRTFQTILRTFDELGYDLQWQVLNSKNFGVPQNRERVFIIGHLGGTPRPEVFPIRKDGELCYEQTESQTANTLTANYWKGPAASRPIIQVNNPSHSNNRVYRTDGISPTLNTMQGGNRQPKILENYIQSIPHGFNTGWQKKLPNLRAHSGAIYNEILMPQIRKLTPVECERLQGFPDGWTEGVSDTQRYKMLGNAVTVNVIYEIAKLL